jgi:hypothetical protein
MRSHRYNIFSKKLFRSAILATCPLRACHLATCQLRACHLATGPLMAFHLATRPLRACHLSTHEAEVFRVCLDERGAVTVHLLICLIVAPRVEIERKV